MNVAWVVFYVLVYIGDCPEGCNGHGRCEGRACRSVDFLSSAILWIEKNEIFLRFICFDIYI